MRFLFFCFLLVTSVSVHADNVVKIAVASNFKPTLEALLPLWQRTQKTKLLISGGPSGVLTQQILSGAPFDVFLSADADLPLHLYHQQLSEKPFVYAQGQLKLGCINAHDSLSNALHSSARLALANIKTAPYGRAAWQWLQRQEPAVTAQIVQTGSVAGALQTVVSGNAPCGLIAASFERLASGLHWYAIETAPNLPQAGVLINPTNPAKQFVEFLLSDQAQGMIRNHSYIAPESQESTTP
ncbi:molybdate ABC transporter substrate-binding protein [Gilvimarinus sp. SDUM040013]|uniref:Molybdate ABC transporter substrate-binding protein n=1 Tax=Gilvimarinus gilvus TaxID=3058038 RepID=A0ABU4RX79_9GAMM|nr:molybdate ABC transporter substrate-binding protein [Gilvimarinus sp. SDUM040013]MDO3386787.1 molybdate ABC transporter substrate-binding protein [Gilvimarinus sp. SDUM040013]MDX6848283.1 molybdate ABC transporter substrate-binding protein [Gilvimarinus sp. SDUM040013]